MKRILSVLCAACLLTLVFTLIAVPGLAQSVRVASLKGPTSMGLVGMMVADKTAQKYEFTVAGTADEIVPSLVRGDTDIALVPCNLASVLYNKTQGGVRIAAVNTLGVLYIVEDGNSVSSIGDLEGKTLYSTGKGTTPEYALKTVLDKSGVTADVEYKSEATEVASALNAKQISLAMLPQPYVTAVMAQNPNLRIALSLTEEWEKVMPQSALITGVVLMRSDFVKNNPESVSDFLADYRLSTAFVNEEPEKAAKWIEELGIAKAAVAEKAIPYCNIVCMEGNEMKDKVSGYLSALYAIDPASVGGTLPDEAFYYLAA